MLLSKNYFTKKNIRAFIKRRYVLAAQAKFCEKIIFSICLRTLITEAIDETIINRLYLRKWKSLWRQIAKYLKNDVISY